MLKKTILAASVAVCGLFALSTGALAADPKAPTPVPYGEQIDLDPAVSMSAAVAKAEKAYDANSTSARLRNANGELFWVVRLEKADGERLAAFIDAKTGEITAARTYGKRGDNARGYPCDGRYDCDMRGERRGCMSGMRGHHRGPGCGGY